MTRPKTAYITGGSSGIARALTLHLLSKGWHVFIADRNITEAKQLAAKFNTTSTVCHYTECDTTSWESQLSAFQTALQVLGERVDFVAPIAGIGERKWLPFPSDTKAMNEGEFTKPDLEVIDVDLTGVLYSIALAVQQFRRQDAIEWGKGQKSRGKIGLVASVCGFYCVPSLPLYTAAKHALVGLTRSYGRLLQGEDITLNAVAPNVVRTSISSDTFYDAMERRGLLTPMEGLMDAFGDMLESEESGYIYECGPKGGWVKREGVEYLDEESKKCCELLWERANALHYGQT
ncbi:Nn.00g041740.m01.CDS01 [Neocucurbitaria sp. VM-36]